MVIWRDPWHLVECNIWWIWRYVNYDIWPDKTIGHKFAEIRQILVENRHVMKNHLCLMKFPTLITWKNQFRIKPLHRLTLSSARYEKKNLYATGTSAARFNTLFFICVLLAGLLSRNRTQLSLSALEGKSWLFLDLYHNSAAESLLFTGKTALLMKNLFFFKQCSS